MTGELHPPLFEHVFMSRLSEFKTWKSLMLCANTILVIKRGVVVPCYQTTDL